ncbi:MAG: PilZ domain-containing protein [Planctomycetes bacterium]|nr:PilZ domain-containing protein [Planctomycetota bacterium]
MHPERTVKKNRRANPRRAPKSSTRVTCRRGTLGLGPNLALSLLDVSETGARLLVKEPLATGQEIELGLLAPGALRESTLPALVVWTLETADGAHCAGVQFQKRLSYAALLALGRLPGA